MSTCNINVFNLGCIDHSLLLHIQKVSTIDYSTIQSCLGIRHSCPCYGENICDSSQQHIQKAHTIEYLLITRSCLCIKHSCPFYGVSISHSFQRHIRRAYTIKYHLITQSYLCIIHSWLCCRVNILNNFKQYIQFFSIIGFLSIRSHLCT